MQIVFIELFNLYDMVTLFQILIQIRLLFINLEIIDRLVEDIVLVSDQEMRDAARWLWFELGVAAELSGAAALAALRAGRVSVGPGERVIALVCGAGSDGLSES